MLGFEPFDEVAEVIAAALPTQPPRRSETGKAAGLTHLMEFGNDGLGLSEDAR